MNFVVKNLKKIGLFTIVFACVFFLNQTPSLAAANVTSCNSGTQYNLCVETCTSASPCGVVEYRGFNQQSALDACADSTCRASVITEYSNAIQVSQATANLNSASNTSYANTAAYQAAFAQCGTDQSCKDAVNDKYKKTQKDSIDCGISFASPSTIPGGAFCYILKVTLLPLATSFMIMASKFLDLSVNWSINGFAQVFSSNSAALYTVWKGVRDVVNILVVFGLFYIAGKYIVKQGEEIRKTFARLIIFALLTNFSLPITKAIVDATNVIGLNIFAAYVTGYDSGRTNSQTLSNETYGLSTKINSMAGANVLIVDSTRAQTSIFSGLNGTTGAFVAIFVTLALTTAIMQSAVLLGARAVTLFFCLVTSPVMFIHALVPKFMGFDISDLSERWRSTFFKAALMAPVMFFMYGLAFAMFGTINNAFNVATNMFNDFVPTAYAAGANGVLDAAGWTSMAAPVIKSILIITMIGYSNRISSNLCGELGDKAGALVGRATNMITGAAVGGTSSWAARKSAGFLAAKVQNSKTVQSLANSKSSGVGGYFTRNLGNSLLKGSSKVMNSQNSLDFVRGGMNASNSLQSAIGIKTYSYGKNANQLRNDAQQFDTKIKEKAFSEAKIKMNEAKKQSDLLESQGKQNALTRANTLNTLRRDTDYENNIRQKKIDDQKQYKDALEVTKATDEVRLENIASIEKLRREREEKLAKLEQEIQKTKSQIGIGLPGDNLRTKAISDLEQEKVKVAEESKKEINGLLEENKRARKEQKDTGVERIQISKDPSLKPDELKNLSTQEILKLNQNKYKESLADTQERIREETLAQTQARIENQTKIANKESEFRAAAESEEARKKAATLEENNANIDYIRKEAEYESAKKASNILRSGVENTKAEANKAALEEIRTGLIGTLAATAKTASNVMNPLQEAAPKKEDFMTSMKKLLEQTKGGHTS